jgi:hypothetical protein
MSISTVTGRCTENSGIRIFPYINPNVAEIFGPKPLRSLYIRPSRNGIFKTSPYVQYAFVLENGQSSLADPIYTVLNSNFMQR